MKMDPERVKAAMEAKGALKGGRCLSCGETTFASNKSQYVLMPISDEGDVAFGGSETPFVVGAVTCQSCGFVHLFVPTLLGV